MSIKNCLFSVSVTMTLAGRLSPCQLPAYLAGQLVGAALGTDNRGKGLEKCANRKNECNLDHDATDIDSNYA
jgi:hypothetical protein